MPPNNQPYIYAPPPRYSNLEPYHGFDPKAVTRASLTPPAPPKSRPQPQGPLIEFNKHPDSYLILPYGQTDAKPMHASTGRAVVITRCVQLCLRVLQMIGALGMLVCVVCIRNTQATEGYVIRIPAAADILTTAYAIYHLFRAAGCRTPASSASYHFFALVIDVGLIPFYIFIAMLAKAQLEKSPKNSMRWKSYFVVAGTDKVLLSTWLDSIVLGALHLVTCLVSLCLVIVFRKIANLPPDLNPFEETLMSRRKSKHKYKNSEISTSDISGPMTESTVSLSKSGRSSPLKEYATADVRPVSFLHTRANSDFSYSPHNPSTAGMSRGNMSVPQPPSMYSQPRTERASRANLPMGQVHKAEDDGNYSRTQTLQSDKSMMTTSSVYSNELEKSRHYGRHTPPLPRKSSKRHSLLSDNWFVYNREESNHCENGDEDISPAISVVDEDEDDIIVHSGQTYNKALNFGTPKDAQRPYQPVRQHSGYDGIQEGYGRSAPLPPPKDDGFLPAPLGMNPPTPPPDHFFSNKTAGRSPLPLNATTGNIQNSSAGNTPSKTKYYGDLGSGISSSRNSPRASPQTIPQRPESSRSQTKYNSADGATIPHPRRNLAVVRPSGGKNVPKDGIENRDFAHHQGERRKLDTQGRVISRSGAELREEESYPDGEDRSSMKTSVGSLRGSIRGRNVSGKVAEEGRGGGWIWGRV